MLKRLKILNFSKPNALYDKIFLKHQFKLFSEVNKNNNKINAKDNPHKNDHNTKKSDPSQEFFYKNTVDDKNLITLKEEQKAKMKSKLILNEPTTQPLLENETYRELYRNFSLYLGEESSKELDEITHNEERDGKVYKYGLPAKNELPFTQLMVKDEVDEKLPKTSTENLFELFELDGSSSYESLIFKIQSEYSHGITN